MRIFIKSRVTRTLRFCHQSRKCETHIFTVNLHRNFNYFHTFLSSFTFHHPISSLNSDLRSKYKQIAAKSIDRHCSATCCARSRAICGSKKSSPVVKQPPKSPQDAAKKTSRLQQQNAFPRFPVHIHNKSTFGKVPSYLKRMKEQLKVAEREECNSAADRHVDECGHSGRYRAISDEEREELLHGLQHNWRIMQNDYQRMPLLIDTVPKKLRKTKLERELKNIERDICMLKTDCKGSKLNVFVKTE